MEKIFKKIGYWSGVVAVSAVLAMTLHYVRAWVEPSTTPPASNVGAPLNTSSTGQYKEGALGVGGMLKTFNGLVVGSSSSPAGKYESYSEEGDLTYDGYIAAKDIWLDETGKWVSDISGSENLFPWKGGGKYVCSTVWDGCGKVPANNMRGLAFDQKTGHLLEIWEGRKSCSDAFHCYAAYDRVTNKYLCGDLCKYDDSRECVGCAGKLRYINNVLSLP